MVQAYRDPWIKKAKWLTQALIISATLNVGLLSTFIYSALSEAKAPKPVVVAEAKHYKSSDKQGMESVFEAYHQLSFQDLLMKLSNTDHVESGYTHRDVALGCLASFHHFNLERALGGRALQMRQISIGKDQKLTLFPGLADYQFQAIVHYAKTEKWPLTSEGLFLEIQKQKPPFDPSLAEAFYLSPEFHYISMLFSKTGINIKREHILSLLAQSSWPTLHEVSRHLEQNSAFTIEERRHLLHQLVQEGSTIAAKILVETDQEYCLKHLDNDQVLILCTLLEDRMSPSFLKGLLQSPRSDEIWKKAASILYEQAAEEPPEELALETAKRRFLELKTPEKSPAAPKIRHVSNRVHTVVAGDSLWKIARANQTTVQTLRDKNHLKTDQLRVGQKLELP